MARSDRSKIKFFLVLFLLGGTLALAYTGKVRKLNAQSRINLEAIPARLGPWKMVQAQQDRGIMKKWEFFNELLMRTYQDPQGRIVWLAISYGADQRQAFSLHLPEGCYQAAGYDVEVVGREAVFEGGAPLVRLVGRFRGRTEPVSYWIVLDGRVVASHLERKIKQLYYTLVQKPAYGVLVRVSSPAAEGRIEQAYALQDDFIRNLAGNLPPQLRKILFGDMPGEKKS